MREERKIIIGALFETIIDMKQYIVIIIALISAGSCQAQMPNHTPKPDLNIVCGAERLDVLLPLLKGKNVALLVNQTAQVNGTHLVDTLLHYGITIKKIYAPEHGFRGTADAGEHIDNATDAKTGIPVISLYGDKKMPSTDDLAGVDVVVFDIQDVGARFYTFISSLHYLMQACAENKKPLIVLDRPNPNGWYVDGPVMKPAFTSFVGVDPIPVVHGLTVGEYAQMVNGESWLPKGEQCPLQVVTCLNYDHTKHYSLPVKPSPNLPNDLAIELYPSICFFEGTNVSVGRGTDMPFQVIGSPNAKFSGAYEFTPRSTDGAKNPPFLKQTCYGFDLRKPENVKDGLYGKGSFTFQYLIAMYHYYGPDRSTFFLKNNFIDKLMGTDEVRKMLEEGESEKEIRVTYQKDLDTYKEKRKRYLLYADFE